EAVRFEEATLQLADSPDLTAQAKLADRDHVCTGGPVSLVRGDGQRDSEIRGGLTQPDTARGVDEDVVLAEVEPRTALQYRNQHVEPIEIDAVDRPAWGAESARGGQALQLDEQGPGSLECDVHHVAHLTERAILQERPAWIGDLVHAAVTHLEDADVVGRTEPFFLAPEDAEGVVPLALEIQHRINDVLEHPRAGDGAFLIDMPDEEDRNLAALGQEHELTRALAHLADASRGRGYAAHEHGLDGIDHRHHRPLRLELTDYGVEVVFRQHLQAVALEPKSLSPHLELL